MFGFAEAAVSGTVFKMYHISDIKTDFGLLDRFCIINVCQGIL